MRRSQDGRALLADYLRRLHYASGMRSLVLTLIAPDRPGLVKHVADTIAAQGGNWEESQFMCLDGQFAGILRVALPDDRLPALRAALESLDGMSVTVTSPDTEIPDGPSHVVELELVGGDHPGIVRDIFAAVAGLEINVVELETTTESAPMSGEPLFRAAARLDVPAHVELVQLSEALESLANEVMVEIRLAEGPSD